jgi:hypothetical protein
MEQGRVSLRAYVVLHSLKRGQPLAVFPHFGRTCGAQSIEGATQFGGQLHRRKLSNKRRESGSHIS